VVGRGTDPHRYVGKETTVPILIDCVMFLNEFELYEARVEMLNRYVDEFVIVEANVTHADKERELLFPAREGNWCDEPHTYIPVVDMPRGGSNWNRVWHHRNALSSFLRMAERDTYYKDALILFSDLDELPNPDLLKEIVYAKTIRAREWIRRIRIGEVGCFCGEMYYYNPLTLSAGAWRGTRIATIDTLLTYGVQACRYGDKGVPQFDIPKPIGEMACLASPACEPEEVGCVHCTYFGGAEMVKEKMLSVAESTDYVTPAMVDIDKLQRNIENAEDPYGRENEIYYRLESPRRSMPEPVLRRFMK
jgi:hypothetical protein